MIIDRPNGLERPAAPPKPPGQPCGFAINGRFYAQPVTGVQRYAREITRALDGLLVERNRAGILLTPAKPSEVPALAAIEVRQVGPMGGHVWEQIVLPARCGAPLLNLCNSAPAVRERQIVCIHDANAFLQPDSYSRSFRLTYRALQPVLARRAMAITTVSRASARQLADHLPVAMRDIAVLPNGHEHALRWDASASRLFGEAPPRRPFVLLLGSRARHKNAALILGLAEALDDLHLDLLVAGGEAGIFAATQAARRPNVRWLGRVSDDDLAWLFAQALCLAFPSFTEGFGLPILEAMALGCPVVSSDRASMPEVCGSAALLASPDDADAWLGHIGALAGSADLRDELRGRGRWQSARFSWAASARGYLDLFGE